MCNKEAHVSERKKEFGSKLQYNQDKCTNSKYGEQGKICGKRHLRKDYKLYKMAKIEIPLICKKIIKAEEQKCHRDPVTATQAVKTDKMKAKEQAGCKE